MALGKFDKTRERSFEVKCSSSSISQIWTTLFLQSDWEYFSQYDFDISAIGEML